MIQAIPEREAVQVCERSTVDPTSSPEFFQKRKVNQYSLAEPPRCMSWMQRDAKGIGSERGSERERERETCVSAASLMQMHRCR